MIILVYCDDEFDCATVGCGMASYNGESSGGHSLISPGQRRSHTVIRPTPETASRIIQEVGATKEHTRVINPTLIAHFEFSSKSSPLQPPQWNSHRNSRKKNYFTHFYYFPENVSTIQIVQNVQYKLIHGF